MTVPLSEELRQALADHPDELVELVDDTSKDRYVLVPAEQFRRIEALLASNDFELRETYEAQSRVLADAGWDDPELDIYNDYDANRS